MRTVPPDAPLPVVFYAGRIASKKEELESLHDLATQARRNYAAHPCHDCEIQRAIAEERLDDFLRANPQLAKGAA